MKLVGGCCSLEAVGDSLRLLDVLGGGWRLLEAVIGSWRLLRLVEAVGDK